MTNVTCVHGWSSTTPSSVRAGGSTTSDEPAERSPSERANSEPPGDSITVSARYDASSRVSCGGRHRGRKAAGKATCRRIVTPRSSRGKDPWFEFCRCLLPCRLSHWCKQALSRPACRRPRRCDQRCPYFFSQFDYKMSTFTGRLALTVWRKEASPRTQQGQQPAHRPQEI